MSVIPATTSAQPLMPQKKAKNDDEPADCDSCKQQSCYWLAVVLHIEAIVQYL